MKLKHGKKYETADGVVYRVRLRDDGTYDMDGQTMDQWREDGTAIDGPDLIRRHYTKPKPAHKLDLKPGDVVKLVKWEDGINALVGKTYKCRKNGPYSEDWEFNGHPKGQRPLFKVVSRVNCENPL
jgi:hypothetical protein